MLGHGALSDFAISDVQNVVLTICAVPAYVPPRAPAPRHCYESFFFSWHVPADQATQGYGWRPTYPDKIDRARRAPEFLAFMGPPLDFAAEVQISKFEWRGVFPDKIDKAPRAVEFPAFHMPLDSAAEIQISQFAWHGSYPDKIAQARAAADFPAFQGPPLDFAAEVQISQFQWRPVYPDKIDQAPRAAYFMELAAPPSDFADEVQVSLEEWRGTYPDWIARAPRVVEFPAVMAPPVDYAAEIQISQYEWRGVFPDKIDRRPWATEIYGRGIEPPAEPGPLTITLDEWYVQHHNPVLPLVPRQYVLHFTFQLPIVLLPPCPYVQGRPDGGGGSFLRPDPAGGYCAARPDDSSTPPMRPDAADVVVARPPEGQDDQGALRPDSCPYVPGRVEVSVRSFLRPDPECGYSAGRPDGGSSTLPLLPDALDDASGRPDQDTTERRRRPDSCC